MALEGLVNKPGALATTAPQLKNRQHSDEITNDRWEVHKDITPDQWEVHELNKRFYTADYAMYAVKDGEAVLYLGRGDTNPFFRDPEAVNQLLKEGNYRPGEEEARAIREVDSTLDVIKLADLDLQYEEGAEWGSFVIDPNDLDKVYENDARQQVAERIYGSTTEVKLDKQNNPSTVFERNMQMMRGVQIAVYLLNQEYVKEHAKEGPIVRAGLLYGSENNYSFNAFVREVNFDIMLRGEPLHDVEDDELVEITNITKDDSDTADKGDVPEIADAVDEGDERIIMNTAEINVAADKDLVSKIADADKIRDAYKTIRRIYRSNLSVARQEMTHDYAFGLSWLVTGCLGQAGLKQKKEGTLFKFLSGIYPKRHNADEIRDAYQTLRSNLDVARQEITCDIASDLSGLVTGYFVQADLKQEKGVSFMNRFIGFSSKMYKGTIAWYNGLMQSYLQRGRQRAKKRTRSYNIHFNNANITNATFENLIVANPNNLKVGTPKVDESKVATLDVGDPTVEEDIIVGNLNVGEPDVGPIIPANPNVVNPNITPKNTPDDLPIESSENSPDDPSVKSSENTSDDQPIVFEKDTIV